MSDQSPRHCQRLARRKAEAGYVMVTTALMLIPMLIFAAFAVDVGSWYVEAQKIQRASDAAALAGVVWMPDENKAREAALEITAINGYEDQPGDFDDDTAALPQVRVSRVGPQQIRVDIRAEGALYFGSVIEGFEEPRIQRFSTSEYVLPVEFGSPTNKIGFGDLVIDGQKVNAWTGMMGYCQPAHFGDVRAAYYQHQNGCIEGVTGSPSSTPPFSNPDTPAGRSPNHDPEGYFFVIDVPEGRAIPTDVMIYDAGYCTGAPGTKPGRDTRETWLEYTLWDATLTPLDDSDITQVGSTYSPGLNVGCNAWTNPPSFEVPLGVSGRFYLQVTNNEDHYGGFGDGVNYFAIEARDDGAGDGTTCFTFDTPTCVGVYARDRLPIRTASEATADVATFYLANVEPIHEGKFLEVEMYDLGERMNYVQFLDPEGNPADFTWRTDDTTFITGIGDANSDHASQTCTGVLGTVTRCLDVSATGIGPKVPEWNSSWRFNGRWVTARISLDSIPEGLDDYWWQIRYVKQAGENSVDWTTWSTRVVGDPVRLIE